MIAAVLKGPNEIEIQEIETPRIGPDEVLVKIGANTVCGTDLRILRGEKTKGVALPTVLGHELAGHITEVGRDVRGYEAGMQVAVSPGVPCGRCYPCLHDMENMCTDLHLFGYDIYGGLEEYVRVPARAVELGNLFVAEKELPAEHLALCEPLACCVNGHRRSGTSVDDAVLIMGAGPIGLFHVQLSRLAGARAIIVSEHSEDRRNMARDFGASVTIDPREEDLSEVVKEEAGTLGVDVAVICIGIPALVNEAIQLTRPGGRVNIFAGLAGKGWAEVEANQIHYKELDVTGTSNSRRREFATALRLIESGDVNVEPMVTHRYPLSEAVQAIEMSGSGEGIKVAVMP
ncbi:MAG TPA: alcohol dehydrogenase catalytic domain-containing protein [Rubrobacteraceae bacterium]|nr:alcohol dehydrogenase catalytic domain-containing protein [Rubrobacteraceae bacterium]